MLYGPTRCKIQCLGSSLYTENDSVVHQVAHTVYSVLSIGSVTTLGYNEKLSCIILSWKGVPECVFQIRHSNMETMTTRHCCDSANQKESILD